MRQPNLGAKLKRHTDKRLGASFQSEVRDQDRRLVVRLFAFARRRVSAVIRLGVASAEAPLHSHAPGQTWTEDALQLLVSSSAGLQWPSAIECTSHPFHNEWNDFKKWALREGLFVRARTDIHPTDAKCTYAVTAWPGIQQ